MPRPNSRAPNGCSTLPLCPLSPSPDPGAGHPLFVRDGTLWSRPFDARRFALGGEAVPIAERAGIFRSPDVSMSRMACSRSRRRHRAVETDGVRPGRHVLGPAGDQGAYWNVALSPDDSRVATIL